MNGSAAGPIQQAVYDILKADSVLMGKVSGIYDEVPTNSVFPYITLGEMTSIPYRAFSVFGEETTVTLHIWSRAKGFKESAAILSDVNRLLADTEITVAGYEIASCSYEFSETLRDEDGITRHIPVRYRIQLQQQ